jgi:gliding motility-associated protein GldM
MAGGKETPRQKLIGLMYLVLLAMLALQVSSDIMFKFVQIESSLATMVEDANTASKSTFEAIKAKAKEDNRPEALEALKEAERLDVLANTIHSQISDINTKLVKGSGGADPETGIPTGMKDPDVAHRILIGPNDKGTKLGLAFEKNLDDFAAMLNKVQKEIAPLTKGDPNLYAKLNLTKKGDEDPFTMKDPNLKKATFLQVSFDHAPMIAALALLRQKDAEVMNLRSKVLTAIKGTFGATDVKFDKVFPMASAESKTVAAGTKYEAKLFITATSSASSFKPKMFMGGRPLKVNSDAQGEVSFRAGFSGGTPVKGNKNLIRKTWQGKIIMKDGTGKDQTYTDKFEYFVAKPVLQVQSASVAALYEQCGNFLSIQCPALGTDYDPGFSATGASVRKGAKTGAVVIIPTPGSKGVALTVNSGGTTLGVEKFKVRPVPKPSIEIHAKGRLVDLKKGI